MARLNLGQIKTAANVRTEGVVKMLQRKAAAVPDGKIRVGVGFSAAYAMFLHEKKEMKWKGLPRGSLAGFQRRKRLPKEGFFHRIATKMGLRKDYKTRVRNLRSESNQARLNARYRTPEERQKIVQDIRKEFEAMRKKGILIRKPKSIHKGFYWDPQDRAQPNFLVGPFREMHGDFVKIIQREMKKTGNIELALLTAGARLQREAQQRVPVEFGFLKASAWTRRLS